MKKQKRLVLLATALGIMGITVAGVSLGRDRRIPVEAVRAERKNVFNSVSLPGSVQAAQSALYVAGEMLGIREAYVTAGDRVRTGDPLVKTVAATSGLQLPMWTTSEVYQMTDARTVGTVAADTLMTAPMDGIVRLSPRAGQFCTAYSPVLLLEDESSVSVVAEVPERYIAQVQVGQKANLTLVSGEGDTIPATVTQIADAATQAISLTGFSSGSTVQVELQPVNPDESLKKGYSVDVQIFTVQHPNAVVVPFEAVHQEGEQEFVYCIRQGCVERRNIQTGYLLENAVEVTAGLQVNDTVVIGTNSTLREGDEVRT